MKGLGGQVGGFWVSAKVVVSVVQECVEWRTSFFTAQELRPEEHLGCSEPLGANLFSGSTQDVSLVFGHSVQAKALDERENTHAAQPVNYSLDHYSP